MKLHEILDWVVHDFQHGRKKCGSLYYSGFYLLIHSIISKIKLQGTTRTMYIFNDRGCSSSLFHTNLIKSCDVYNMCMYVCIYMRIYMHIYACVYMCIYVCIHMHVYICVYVCIYACVDMFICVSKYMHVYIF